MNPFNKKTLEEFTIADCEHYLSHYAYGEHVSEVKIHLRKLKQVHATTSNAKNRNQKRLTDANVSACKNTYEKNEKKQQFAQNEESTKISTHKTENQDYSLNSKQKDNEKNDCGEIMFQIFRGIIILGLAILITGSIKSCLHG